MSERIAVGVMANTPLQADMRPYQEIESNEYMFKAKLIDVGDLPYCSCTGALQSQKTLKLMINFSAMWFNVLESIDSCRVLQELHM